MPSIQLAAGDGSAGLTTVLARMGVKYVLVRNDLARSALVEASPARIHDALAASPGMTLAAQFGPAVGGGTPDDAVADFDTRYPAVQIYRVAGSQAAAVVQSAAGTLRVYGAPEAMITLANEDLLGNRPVLINGDGAGQPVTARSSPTRCDAAWSISVRPGRASRPRSPPASPRTRSCPPMTTPSLAGAST